MRFWKLLKAYGEQVFIAADQLLNALIPPLDGTVSYADETLSARCYRAHRDGKIMGKMFMPLIDLLFFWQGQGIARTPTSKSSSARTTRTSTEQVCRFLSHGNSGAVYSVWG